MVTIVTRAGKGSPLTNSEVDANFNNLKTAVEAVVASTATVASASTTDIGSQTSTYVSVTGTTTITALGTAPAGTFRFVDFAGALTLTHNATSLILNKAGTNITTAAGDTAIFVSKGSGNWKCISYTRLDGTALVSSGGVTSVAGLTGAPTASDVKTALSLSNVENKSSETIRGELTSSNVNTALGITVGSMAARALTISTSAASGGANGDVWMQV